MSIGFSAITRNASISSDVEFVIEDKLKDQSHIVHGVGNEPIYFFGCSNIQADDIYELYFVGNTPSAGTYNVTCDASANQDNSIIVYFNSTTGVAKVVAEHGVVYANAHTHFALLRNCSVISFVDNGVTRFNTKYLTSMYHMFFNLCSSTDCSMSTLDLSFFDTSNVTDKCSGLTSLNLSSFDTSKVGSFHKMFSEASNLSRVYVGSGWSTSKVGTCTVTGDVSSDYVDCDAVDMFYSTSLSSTHHSIVACSGSGNSLSYAHIDNYPSNPGCLDDVSNLNN